MKTKYNLFRRGRVFYSRDRDPALISMPTGSGKTTLMMMLALLLKPERVIIITPSVALRGQTAVEFREMADLKSAGALPSDSPLQR